MMSDKLLASLNADPLIASARGNSRFVMVGWTRNKKMLPEGLSELAQERGLDYLTWDYGPEGSLFLLNSHADIACADEAVVVKLQAAHSVSLEWFCARDLLEQGLIGPGHLNTQAIRGKPTLFYVSQREPNFWAYQSLLSTSQVYYWRDDDWIICTDALRHLVKLVPQLELDDEARLYQLLFRSLSGKMTCFKGVYKLLSGYWARYQESTWEERQVECLDDLIPEQRFSKITPAAISYFEQQVQQVVEAGVGHITRQGYEPKVLLSGGVDSTLLASLVKAKVAPQQLRSTSFAIRVPSFHNEIEYAQYGINLLQADHQFVEVDPNNHPALLEQLIRIVAHPIGDEHDPCNLALAQFHSRAQETPYFLSGAVMDTLFGNSSAKRLRQVRRFHHIPGAKLALEILGQVLEPVWHNKAYGMRKIASVLRFLDDTLSFQNLLNNNPLTDFNVIQKGFDSQAIRQALEYRHNLFDHYSSSQDLVERAHLMVLTHPLHDDETSLVEIFHAYNLDYVTPYFDSDLVRCSFTFEPQIRYYSNGQSKWLTKQLLEKRTGYQTRLPQYDGGFGKELFEWMKQGVLRDMVSSMERPGYMSVADFKQKQEEPDWFTWNILNWAIFQKSFQANYLTRNVACPNLL